MPAAHRGAGRPPRPIRGENGGATGRQGVRKRGRGHPTASFSDRSGPKPESRPLGALPGAKSGRLARALRPSWPLQGFRCGLGCLEACGKLLGRFREKRGLSQPARKIRRQARLTSKISHKRFLSFSSISGRFCRRKRARARGAGAGRRTRPASRSCRTTSRAPKTSRIHKFCLWAGSPDSGPDRPKKTCLVAF